MAEELKPCSVDGCKRPLRAKGLCTTHYYRLTKNGSPHMVRGATPMVSGERHGRLVAIARIGQQKSGGSLWRFQCDCGTETTANVTNVRSGNTMSCGCRRREIQSSDGPRYVTHGMTGTPAYESWRSMWARCSYPSHPAFKHYGGRGIAICKQWQTFEGFYKDMGPRPQGTSLDRHPNKDGNYEPGNVRWASNKEQGRNKRTTRMVTFQGRTMPISEAAELAGLSLQRVKARLRNGWDTERAFTTPIDDRFSR